MRTKSILSLLLLLTSLGVLVGCSSKKTDTSKMEKSAAVLYHCAMHPQIVSDKPGECPICHMQLTPTSPGPMPASMAPRKLLFYRNPMDPSVTSPVPMKDGMGMDYIPVYNDAAFSRAEVSGLAPVHMDPGIEQQTGVVVATATVRDLTIPIRASAQVAYDPQLYSAAVEHQEALAFLRKAQAHGSPDLLDQARSTVQASQLRLHQMGLASGQIAEMSAEGYDPSGLLVGSERGGRAWVYANVSDTQANLIRRGQSVELTSPSLPGASLHGRVQSVDSILNNETRTVRVRIQVQSGVALRPQTYVTALIQASMGQHLTIPESAVVDTGLRQIVYVERTPGTYEPREVRVGLRSDVWDEIVSGLEEGERVVSSANFFIDSESRIQAATQEATHDR